MIRTVIRYTGPVSGLDRVLREVRKQAMAGRKLSDTVAQIKIREAAVRASSDFGGNAA